MSRYLNLKVATKDSEATLEGEVPVAVVETYRQEALKGIQENLEIAGFRKGQAPLDIVEKQVNAVYVLEEAADLALQDIYPEIIVAEHLKTLGRPQVTITKLAPGNPITFKIRVGLLPEFSLPDYKKIAKNTTVKEETIVVHDEEVEKTIEQILTLRKKDPADPLPALTDDLVKTLGAFENVADLKKKVRLSIEEEKMAESRRARREAIAEKLAAETKMALPELFVEEELVQMREDRDHELQRAGMTMEVYLQNMSITGEKLAEQERTYVERQIKTKFILQKIAETEKITATDIEIGDHVDVLRRRHPEIDLERLRSYVRSMLINEKVLELLEGKKKEEPQKSVPASKEETKKLEDQVKAAATKLKSVLGKSEPASQKTESKKEEKNEPEKPPAQKSGSIL